MPYVILYLLLSFFTTSNGDTFNKQEFTTIKNPPTYQTNDIGDDDDEELPQDPPK